MWMVAQSSAQAVPPLMPGGNMSSSMPHPASSLCFMACADMMREGMQDRSQAAYLGEVFLARVDRALHVEERAVVLLRLHEYPVQVLLRELRHDVRESHGVVGGDGRVDLPGINLEAVLAQARTHPIAGTAP